MPRGLSATLATMKTLITVTAMLGYGLWAYVANCNSTDVSNAEQIALRAGLIQGGYSGLLTLATVVALEWLYRRLRGNLPKAQAIVGSATLALAGQYGVIVPIHLLNQTPNIVLTLLPGFIIGSLFNLSYTRTYARRSQAPRESVQNR